MKLFKHLSSPHYWIKDWLNNDDYGFGPSYTCHCRYCGKVKRIKWDEVINYEQDN